MEKMKTSEAKHKYPKQWIVMINTTDEKDVILEGIVTTIQNLLKILIIVV